MRVFVTGASGFIGSAVVAELLGAGHEVVGLARSDESAAALAVAGAGVHRGALDDLDSLREGATASEGVIHLAYQHDFVDMVAAADDDLRAVQAMCEVLEGTDKPFTTATGTLGLVFGYPTPLGRTGTEDDVPELSGPRINTENALATFAQRGVRTSVVRLAPTVHGEDDHGFVPRLIAIFRLALESAPAGSRLHGVADEGVQFRSIAEAISRHLDVPVVSVSPQEAEDHFGFLGFLVQLDNPTSSQLTQERLGWQPTHAALIADLDEGHYFNV